MEIKEFVQSALDRVKQATTRAVTGLSHQELAWRPGPECNSIGLILFHQARFEDTFVQTRMRGQSPVWATEKWYEKLNMPVGEGGSGYTSEQIVAFPVPELADLTGYAEAVRAQTLQYLGGLTNDEFSKIINLPRLGDVTIGALFTLIVVHLAQHAGEIAYLRGMQRGMNK